jgi:hypothetical protein
LSSRTAPGTTPANCSIRRKAATGNIDAEGGSLAQTIHTDDGVIARSAAGSRVKVYLTERQALRLLCIGGRCNLAPFEEFNHWRMP